MSEPQADLEEHVLRLDGVPLVLTVKKNPECAPVLLLHGASARHETFRFPPAVPAARGSHQRSLMDWLHLMGFEPWLLDWRGSGRVVDALASGPGGAWGQLDLDAAARCDLPAALLRIHELRGGRATEIAVVGHCLGAAILAQAIAEGSVSRQEHAVSHVVLLTLGLFYEPPLDGRLKTQDPVLERLLATGEVRSIDPRTEREPWPEELAEFYLNWPSALRPHPENSLAPASCEPARSCVFTMCDRLSFMYGAPYFERNLAPGIHEETWTVGVEKRGNGALVGETLRGSRSGASGVLAEVVQTSDDGRTSALVLARVAGEFEHGEVLRTGAREVAACFTEPARAEAQLPAQFGAIPLRMYVHAARNARRGWGARWDALEDDPSLLGAEALRNFGALERVALITGESNQLWHRNSVDRMFEWLSRAFEGTRRKRLRKRVLRGYGHQDLLWGRSASRDVFPCIRDAIHDVGGGREESVDAARSAAGRRAVRSPAPAHADAWDS
jgi:hypothetical protein